MVRSVPRNGMRVHVLMVSPGFLPIVGGVETHVYEVSRRLVQQGVDVTVLTTDRSGALPTEETIEGITVHRVRAYPSARDWYLAPGLVRSIRAARWNVVHCQGAHTLVPPLAMASARSAGLPYVVTFHSGGHSSSARNAARRVQLAVLRPWLMSASSLIAVSRFEAAYLASQLRLSPRRFVVIPNGADMPSPSAHAPVPGSSTGPLIVSVGRLERFKGHHRVLQALPAIAASYPDVRLEIIGNGPYEGDLRALAKDLDLEDRVIIRSIPTAERRSMADLLASADVVTLLSDFESHGLAAVEAVALRRPVLVAYGSALKELVDQGFARGVPVEADTPQVAAALVAALDDPWVPGERPVFTWDDCAEKLHALYRELVA